ncbi:23S rRNA pseudouridine(2604) synthase RluF [Clostridium sp. 19966]|uniref:23S rRNA pseudouridine(2604) synthase RluF n=1 Tax=Clostridium sp. 19966 TaxID=2768166 RepID=UPI0028E421C5|nr:23S rRNA pseudouridine(2604) synthase RluF [Clostridium sp. 19966]
MDSKNVINHNEINNSIRINKFISESGFCSRREADRLIEAKRVTINGNLAVQGTKVSKNDVVCVDGKSIAPKDDFIYIAFNKPRGITCTTDTNIKDNIVDYINYPIRIFHIGRLDKDSEGLIFMTNDGDIVNKILRSGNNHEKEYIVTVDKPINEHFIHSMENGVRILGTITKHCKVKKEASNVFRITLTQGLNRQIRRMCEALGYTVKKLVRIRIMNVTLGNLRIGEWRYLSNKELKEINFLISDSIKTEEASKPSH